MSLRKCGQIDVIILINKSLFQFLCNLCVRLRAAMALCGPTGGYPAAKSFVADEFPKTFLTPFSITIQMIDVIIYTVKDRSSHVLAFGKNELNVMLKANYIGYHSKHRTTPPTTHTRSMQAMPHNQRHSQKHSQKGCVESIKSI